MAIFNDVSSRDFITSDIIKGLTGGDSIQINPKGEKAFTVKLNLKIFVCSNKKPTISSQSSDQRRLLFCELKPFNEAPDVEYTQKLWAERSAILFQCREAYSKLTVNHGPIKQDLGTNHDHISDEEDVFKHILSQNFKIGPENKMKPQELAFLARRICKENDLHFHEFKAWLYRNYPIIRTHEEAEEGSRRNIIKGIAPVNTFFTLFLISMSFLESI